MNTIDSQAMRGFVKSLIESVPVKTRAFRHLIGTRLAGQLIAGVPACAGEKDLYTLFSGRAVAVVDTSTSILIRFPS